jgi:hypothetical protein
MVLVEIPSSPIFSYLSNRSALRFPRFPRLHAFPCLDHCPGPYFVHILAIKGPNTTFAGFLTLPMTMNSSFFVIATSENIFNVNFMPFRLSAHCGIEPGPRIYVCEAKSSVAGKDLRSVRLGSAAALQVSSASGNVNWLEMAHKG